MRYASICAVRISLAGVKKANRVTPTCFWRLAMPNDALTARGIAEALMSERFDHCAQ